MFEPPVFSLPLCHVRSHSTIGFVANALPGFCVVGTAGKDSDDPFLGVNDENGLTRFEKRYIVKWIREKIPTYRH